MSYSHLKESKILITGGGGFIGSALVWHLNQLGIDNILVTDFLREDERFKNLVPLRFADYMEGDSLLSCIQSQDSKLEDIGYIFHLGACSSTAEKNCRYLIHNNYEYTKTLAEWSLDRGIRFVYASSAATYGNGAQGMEDEGRDIQDLRPLNMYGYSKHLFDLYAQKNGFLNKIVGLKYFNVFGPNENHKGDMRSVVHKAFQQIIETGKVKLFKSYKPNYRDGEQMRDFLYVKDAVKMTVHLAQNEAAGGLYNVGSGEANTWNTLVHGIYESLNKNPSIEYIDMPESLRDKYQYHTCANILKLKKTGYQDSLYTLQSAIHDYVQNYLVPQKYLGE